MKRSLILGGLIAVCLAIIAGRALAARAGSPPRTFHVFDTLIVAGALIAIVVGYRTLTWRDGLLAAGMGLFIGVQTPFAVLFTPYPFLDIVQNPYLEGAIRGLFITIALLGGLVIMHSGGPVRVRLAQGQLRAALVSLALGAALGLPLAVLNMFANRMTQGRPFDWQSPWNAIIDALQPGVYEEVVYRLAFLGLLWWILRRGWAERPAAILAAVLATLVHSFSHLDDLLLDQPFFALAMGTVMALVWGAPMAYLALRRDLESAAAFHWIHDALHFLAEL